MATREPTINDALAEVLRKTRHAWRGNKIVRSENTRTIKGSNETPDILVTEFYVSPVIIETEVLPATTVEKDAISRLGKHLRSNRKVLSSIAVRLPNRLRSLQGLALQNELEKVNDFEMALFTGSSPEIHTRWPRSGWIQGSVNDLSILVQYASIPPEVIDEAADQLIEGVTVIANQLDEIAINHPGSIKRISNFLCQEDGTQTRRMAATILTNAFVFHDFLAGGKDELEEIKSIDELKNSKSGILKTSILREWDKILEINYWPIFDIARRIFATIPFPRCSELINELVETAENLSKNQLMRSHDLTGAVFQRVIADRKFLAAFYTTPASAALLVGLAITPESLPNGKSWSSEEDVKSLRIADFACGTGTLLSTAYQHISQLHEIAGGDAKKLHSHMMATALVGCDVLPAAAHLTASMLAGAHPTVKYNQSSILTVAYGKQSDGAFALGSLNLLDPQGKFEILSITAKAITGTGENELETWKTLPHASFDVVIMNPPFTSATSHEGKNLEVPNPIFAAFGSSSEVQRAMADATRILTRNTSAHGNAGEASIFLVLADYKLKIDGVLALVMPLSLISGEAWKKSREFITKNYTNIIVISISGSRDAELSFSADTDMGECLIIGKKSKNGSKRATFVILKERPAFPLIGLSIADEIRRLLATIIIRKIEDGPIGGTAIYFGNELFGQVLDAPLPASNGWYLSRISDLSLAQTAYQITSKNRIWLPSMNEAEVVKIPITSVSRIGAIGPLSRDINGTNSNGSFRGPFDIFPVKQNSAPTYPALWAHNAIRERKISFEADSEGIQRQGSTGSENEIIAKKVASVWETASHCHFNCDFRFNSQSTGMQFTQRRTIGGRAWQTIKLANIEQEKILVLWANTSIGLLLRWWYSNKQQSGRGSISKSVLKALPVLDVTTLTSKQIKEAVKIFDYICNKELLPLHEIDKDPVRKELDELFMIRVLGLKESLFISDGPFELLRMKLSREPSIRGSK
ncbi:SAM-dependent methyltransferase [bacterium]|nr:SAM-dependent methyltransferase [bacterium]